jgi:hypothetical protein
MRNAMNVILKSTLSPTTQYNLLFEGSVHTVEAGNCSHSTTNNSEFFFLFRDAEKLELIDIEDLIMMELVTPLSAS